MTRVTSFTATPTTVSNGSEAVIDKLYGNPLPLNDKSIEIIGWDTKDGETELDRLAEALTVVENEFYEQEEAIYDALIRYAEKHKLR